MASLNDIQVNIVVSLKGQNKLKALENAMRGIVNVQSGLTKSVGKSVNSLKQLQTAASNGATALNQYKTAAKGATGGAAKAASGQTAAAATVTRAVATQQKAFGNLGTRLGETEKRYDAVFRASFRLQLVGAEMTLMGVKAITTVMGMADAWGTFEFMVNRAAGAVQLFKGESAQTDALYSVFIDRIMAVSKELRLFPADDVAKSVYYWASTTGQAVTSINDMRYAIEAVTPIMKVAAMTQTDYETAIKGVYSILVQYGLGLDHTADVTNKLFLAAQRTALEFPDLINSFKMVGPVAGALGISFEDVTNLLAQLGDAGIRGTMSGRALRQMFIKLTKPTAIARTLLDNLFRSTKALSGTFEQIAFPNGEFVGTKKYIEALALALQHADSNQRNFVLGTITTANELPAMTALVAQQIDVLNGVPGAAQHVKQGLTDTAYAAEQFAKSWEILSNSWKGVTERLARGIEVIRLKIGRQLADAMQPLVEAFTKVLDRIERWIGKNPEIVQAIGKIALVAGSLLAIAGAAFTAMGVLLGVGAAIGYVAESVGFILPKVLVFVGLLTSLGEAVLNNVGRIQRLLLPALANLGDALGLNKKGLEGLSEWWASVHDSVRKFADVVVKQVIGALKAVIDAAAEVARSPLRPFIEAIARSLALAFAIKTIANILGIGAAIVKIGAMAKTGTVGVSLFGAAMNGLKTAGPLLVVTGLVTAFQILNDTNFLGFGGFVKGITNSFKDLTGEVKDFEYSYGEGGREMTAWMTATVVESQKLGDALRIQALNYAKFQADLAAGRDVSWYRDNGALAQQAAGVKSLIDGQQALADKHAVSARDIGESMRSVTRTYKMTYSDATKYADLYFQNNEEGVTATQESVTKAYYAIAKSGLATKYGIGLDAMLKANLDPSAWQQILTDRAAKLKLIEAQTLLKDGKLNPAVAILDSLQRNQTSYSDDIQKSLEATLSGIPKALQATVAEAEQIATQAPADILLAMQNGITAVGDFATTLATMNAGKHTAVSLVKGLFGSIDSKSMTGALDSQFMDVRLFAQDALDNMSTQFNLLVTQFNPKEKADVAGQLRKLFGKSFATGKVGSTLNGVPLSSDQQVYLQQMMDWAYTQLGLTKPSPAVVTTTNAQVLKNMSAAVGATAFENRDDQLHKQNATTAPMLKVLYELMAPIKDPAVIKSSQDAVNAVTVAPVNNAISGMPGQAVKMYAGGQNIMQAWINGATSVQPKVQKLATDMAGLVAYPLKGNSPPKGGPLKHIDKGGANIAHAWVKGIKSQGSAARKAAGELSSHVNSALSEHAATIGKDGSISVSSDATRKVDVSISVSSPDGTANKMTQQQILTALRSGGLISNIERLATVG